MHDDRTAALAPLGWNPARAAELDALGRGDAVPARIGRVNRGGAVALSAGRPVRVEAGGLATGDWVALAGERVHAVLERRTLLARRAAGRTGARQPIAANVDLVVVVHGLDRPLRDRRLHRALALAWDAGTRPLVALTKADLDDAAPSRALAAEAAFGVDAIAVSAARGEGLEALAARAAPDRTLVLIGESGAGKSTLVNALAERGALATGAVRAGDAKGRHTTTARHLVPLPGGGALIDTPGVRELGLWGGEEGVAGAFADISRLAEGCRFTDCRHGGEPGCAVAAAAREGGLDPGRLDSFRDLAREAEAQARRSAERERRAHGRRASKALRRSYRERGR